MPEQLSARVAVLESRAAQAPEITERLVVIEERLKNISEALEQHVVDDRRIQGLIETKLDELLTLRNKGLGVFWVISIVVGGIMFFAKDLAAGLKAYLNG